LNHFTVPLIRIVLFLMVCSVRSAEVPHPQTVLVIEAPRPSRGGRS